MAKLLICDSVDVQAVDAMRAAGVVVDVRDTITADELAQVIGEYDGIVVRSRTKVRAPVLQNPGKLKVIIRGGVGVDNIDVAVAESKGIKVLNTPAASSNAVAELALAMMFALARHLAWADASMKAGRWEKKNLEGSEIAGKTLGIIGYGHIGQRLAEQARALGMTVVACDPYIQNAALVSLDELLARADYVSLHVPYAPKTHNLLGAAQLAMMKPGACVINAARGGVVDEDALYAALVSGHLAGAALDVFTAEPPQSATLRALIALPQVVATPHIGAATVEAQERIGGEIVALVQEYLVA
ncbi:MAG TPA: D-2-hydroxyacid dehydrogenase [Anaerolineae bacterium]|nr:D-2-hydroxyacid dehydrogenase [Anaerolineae bacterium]HQH39419.1 D-2-hydroxyacid dehydrogenase [Anaerolineae bacterium]